LVDGSQAFGADIEQFFVNPQRYGKTGFTALGYNNHNGIDLAAPAGTPIYAAGDGTVVGADTGEAAYGNWVAIKHSIETKQGTTRQVVALYAHMRTFKVKVGQKVLQRDF
jgi:murein DD-endopeptidase MepM/ murein hydrolase activator NlpD